MRVPVAEAELTENLKSGSKVNLADVLLKVTECPDSVTLCFLSNMIIDGQAIVRSLGKPDGARTFGDVADVFVRIVLYKG